LSGVVTTLAGWPLTGFLAMILLGERLRAARRRAALNCALHELRRPLQLLALTPAPGPGSPDASQLAIAALSQLDSEINGHTHHARRLVSAHEIAGGAVGRWRRRAKLGGGSLVLRWRAGRSPVLGDPVRISQALDNLIVNALEHGGPNIVVDARCVAGRLRISVADDGRTTHVDQEGRPVAGLISRLRGRSRHGHGLEVVRSVAAAHQGRFALQRSDSGAVAVLELPLAGADGALAA
jgi:signal transduction histidine kinase